MDNLIVSADVDEFEKVGTEISAATARSTICCTRDAYYRLLGAVYVFCVRGSKLE